MATITTPNTEHYCQVHAGIAWLSSLANAIDAGNPNNDVGAYLWNIIFDEKDKQADCADETAQLYPECLPCSALSRRRAGSGRSSDVRTQPRQEGDQASPEPD